MDDRDWRSGAKTFPDRLRRSRQKISTGGANLPAPLRRGVVDGRPLGRLPFLQVRRAVRAALIGGIRALYVFLPTGRSRGTKRTIISLALLRRPAPERSDERVDAADYWNLWPAITKTTRCAFAFDRSVEIRLQKSKVDRENRFHRGATPHFLERFGSKRVQFPIQRRPGCAASALVADDRAGHWHRYAYPDIEVQRLLGLCGLALRLGFAWNYEPLAASIAPLPRRFLCATVVALYRHRMVADGHHQSQQGPRVWQILDRETLYHSHRSILPLGHARLLDLPFQRPRDYDERRAHLYHVARL